MNAAEFMPALTDMRFRAGSSRRLGFRICDGGQCASAQTQSSQRLLNFQSPSLLTSALLVERIARYFIATASGCQRRSNVFHLSWTAAERADLYEQRPEFARSANGRYYHASISQLRPTSGPATAARPFEIALAGLG